MKKDNAHNQVEFNSGMEDCLDIQKSIRIITIIE